MTPLVTQGQKINTMVDTLKAELTDGGYPPTLNELIRGTTAASELKQEIPYEQSFYRRTEVA